MLFFNDFIAYKRILGNTIYYLCANSETNNYFNTFDYHKHTMFACKGTGKMLV